MKSTAATASSKRARRGAQVERGKWRAARLRSTLSMLLRQRRCLYSLQALRSELTAVASTRRVKNSNTHFKNSEHRFYRRWFYIWVTPLFLSGPGVGVLAAAFLYGDSSRHAYVVGSRLKKAATWVGAFAQLSAIQELVANVHTRSVGRSVGLCGH